MQKEHLRLGMIAAKPYDLRFRHPVPLGHELSGSHAVSRLETTGLETEEKGRDLLVDPIIRAIEDDDKILDLSDT